MGLSSLSLLSGSDFSTGEIDSRSLDEEFEGFLPQFFTKMCLCLDQLASSTFQAGKRNEP